MSGDQKFYLWLVTIFSAVCLLAVYIARTTPEPTKPPSSEPEPCSK